MKKTLLLLLLVCNSYAQNFGDFASGIKINNTIYNTTASAQIHQIDPNNGALWLDGSNLGNFGELTSCSRITGAEIKTFKNTNANVCSATLFWRVYPSGNPSGAFHSVALSTISECNLSASPAVFYDNLGPCGARDQKWKDYSLSINFTQGLTVGNYVFEIYYSYTGSATSSSTCETTRYISNNGNNFKATFSVVKPATVPTVSQTSLCEGDSLTLSATVTNAVPPYTYQWTGPNGYTSNASSPVISNITLSQAGTYNLIITDSCGSTSIIQSTQNVTVIAKTTPVFAFGTSNAICSGDAVPLLPGTSSNGYTGTWNPSVVDNTQTGNYVFTPNSGQCANTTAYSVNVTQPTIATFNPIAAICNGTTPPLLPTTSNEGYTGSWSPSVVNNTQTTNYVFTPDAGQCAAPGNLSVAVFNPNTTPVFSIGTSLTSCASNTQTTLPTLSDNGIIGVWNPAVLDYSVVGTTHYTFTPNPGQCAVNTSLDATINTNTTPTFNPINPICAGDSAVLPTSSLEGINGSWTPAIVNNTQSTTYTFIPNSGLCATTGSTLSINVNQPVTATFNAIPSICTGTTAPVLPTTSLEGFSGNWTPSVVDNTQTLSYSFTPTTGQCAAPGSVTVIVNNNITPTFTIPTSICYGASLTLPNVSNEGITGTWNPSTVDNTQSTNYTFLPDSGQCATSITKNIAVTSLTIPTFIAPAPICNGTTAPTLPTTSLNGITGTWSPATVSNTQSGNYVFTPDNGQCAGTTQLSVTVYQNCSFGSFASAVWLTNCAANGFFNTVGSGSSIIGPSQNIFPNTDFGTFLVNSGTFKLRGAEVKTFKNNLANVCSARLHYRIYQQSGTPGPYTVMDLPFFDDCSGGSFPTGGPCNNGDQKWQRVLNDAQFPVDLTAFSAGNYVIEIFYDITGDSNSTSGCDETILIDNIGNNFIATYSLQNNPVFTASNPTTCHGNNGSILITGLTPNTNYQLAYNDDGSPIQLNITSNNNGDYTLAGLNAGSYTNITINGINSCLIGTGNITLSDPVINSTFNAINPFCSGDNSIALPATSIEGFTGTWSPAFSNTQTNNYTFTPDSGQCAANGSLTLTVNQNVTPTFAQSPSYCAGSAIPALPTTSNEGISGTWSPAIDNSQTTNYIFTPNSGQCALTNNQTITVNQNATPTFAQSPSYCAGSVIPALPTTSNEGITGAWSPAIDNSQTTNYIFTPNSGQCALTNNQTITVNQKVTPTFAQSPSYCAGSTIPALPTTSIEGITGTWSPAIDNSQTTNYIFTPNSGQCALTNNQTITVNQNVTPTFTPLAPLCFGGNVPILPLTSIEGITGSWSPSQVDNTQTGNYDFIPNPGQCSLNGSTTVTVQNSFDFEMAGSCVGYNFEIQVNAINNSFDPSSANYDWFTNGGQAVGSNQSSFNVTEYLNSTPETETLPITFNVTVTTPDGCYKNESITLASAFCGIQKGISANNDGLNDFFDLQLLNVKKLEIFNRYGMKVYSKYNYTKEWIGQSDNGNELPDATYYYVIEFNDGKSSKTGWIYLNRER